MLCFSSSIIPKLLLCIYHSKGSISDNASTLILLNIMEFIMLVKRSAKAITIKLIQFSDINYDY